MRFLTQCILLMLFVTVSFAEEQCSSENSKSCKVQEHNMYSKESNEIYRKYFEEITLAEKNYVECNNTNCKCYWHVITRDLQPFKEDRISRELIDVAKSRGTFYQIIDNKLYRQKDCMFPSRCSGIEHFLFKIIDSLPNMDIVINTRDYPQSSKHFTNPIPIFSFSKTSDYYDIIYPAWSFWEGGPAISLYPRGIGRWDQHRISLNDASKKYLWEKKEKKVFFRGSRTSSERDNLILLSRRKPELVDAQYTKNQAWKSIKDTLDVPPAPEVSFEHHCKYKYLFNYRGVAASFRHKHLFLCQSLIFHVGDEWTEFYYTSMKPWIHYIPVVKDANQTTLEGVIQFAKHNDDIAAKIAKRGRDFVWDNLQMSHITCFWRRLLKSYAKLLSYKPSLDKDLIEIQRK